MLKYHRDCSVLDLQVPHLKNVLIMLNSMKHSKRREQESQTTSKFGCELLKVAFENNNEFHFKRKTKYQL